MIVYNKLEDINLVKEQCVALGFFDGVHLGHKKVIDSAKNVAINNNFETSIFTFYFENNKRIKSNSIFSIDDREKRINKLIVENYISVNFSEIKNYSPSEFVNIILKQKLKATNIFCGQNYKFGKNASGDVNTLKKLCSEVNIKVNIVEMAVYENKIISSTRIKNELQLGNIEKVNAMLGYNYCIDFKVIKGEALGRTMGFPTINQIYPSDFILPKQGVYITKTIVDGKSYPSATGITTRPTVNGKGVSCETFIVGLNQNLYNEKPIVEFYKYFGDVHKFENIEELKTYINKAVEETKKYFSF